MARSARAFLLGVVLVRAMLVASIFLATVVAQKNLITVNIGVAGTPGTTDVTLDSNGGIHIDLPWPIPNENAAIPASLVPPNAVPAPAKLILGTAPTIDAAKRRVAGALAGYLLYYWTLHGPESLAKAFSILGDPPSLVSQPAGGWEGFGRNLGTYTRQDLASAL